MISPIYESAKLPLKLYVFERGYPFVNEICIAPNFDRACELLNEAFGSDIMYDSVTEHQIEEGFVSQDGAIEVDSDE